MAYSKQENAIIEKANTESNRHIRAIIFDRMENTDIWFDVLPLIKRIMNSEKVDSIGVSPAELLFRSQIQLDKGIFLLHIKNRDTYITAHGEEQPKLLSQWVSRMLEAQIEFIHTAQETQRKRDAKHMQMHTPETVTEFPVSSYVLVLYLDGAMERKPTTKFHTFWKGPFRVVNTVGSKYTVKQLVTGKNQDLVRTRTFM